MSVILKVLVASKSTDPSDGSHIGIQREVEINLVTRVDKLRPGKGNAEGSGTATKEVLVPLKRRGCWTVRCTVAKRKSVLHPDAVVP